MSPQGLVLTYEPLDLGVILIGNDAQCNVISVGTVRIRTQDGMVRTFPNVDHIPNLKTTLFVLAPLNPMDASLQPKLQF